MSDTTDAPSGGSAELSRQLNPDTDLGEPLESWTHQIAQDVFHILHPICPAFPSVPNPCSPLICDCGAGDNSGPGLAEQVAWLRDRREDLEREVAGLRAFKENVDAALNIGDGVYRP